MDPGTKCKKTNKHTKTHTTQNCIYETVGILVTDWTFKNKVLVFYYEYIILKSFCILEMDIGVFMD